MQINVQQNPRGLLYGGVFILATITSACANKRAWKIHMVTLHIEVVVDLMCIVFTSGVQPDGQCAICSCHLKFMLCIRKNNSNT